MLVNYLLLKYMYIIYIALLNIFSTNAIIIS